MSRRGAEPSDDATATGERIRALASTVAAPERLRRRIETQRRVAAGPAPRSGVVRGRRVAIAVGALGVAVVAAALLMASPRESAFGPSAADAAAVALMAPSGPPPARTPSVDGVRFPDDSYSAQRWRAVGIRRQVTAGRRLAAVAYDGGDGARMGYTIVAAPALQPPPHARLVTRSGMRFRVFAALGATVVLWQRSGRTCVIASRTASEARLLRFAADGDSPRGSVDPG